MDFVLPSISDRETLFIP